METLIVMILVGSAAAYIGWRLWRTFFGGGGNCGCGSKKGCAKMTEAMDHAERVSKPRH